MPKFGKIKSLSIVTRDEAYIYTVGSKEDGRIIKAIEDRGVEYPNGINFLYWIIDVDDCVIATVENCPVVVYYDKHIDKEE